MNGVRRVTENLTNDEMRGFRLEREYADYTFTLKQLDERAQEKKQRMHLRLATEYDRGYRGALGQIVRKHTVSQVVKMY